MKHSWLWWKHADVVTEQRQLTDEGKQLSPKIEKELHALRDESCPEDASFQERFNALLDQTIYLPTKKGFAFNEPSDLDGIKRARPAGPRRLPVKISPKQINNKIHGAWLGRCAGCLLGKPIEGTRSNVLWPILEASGKTEFDNFIHRLGISKPTAEKHEWIKALKWAKDVDCMPEDDDTNYTVTGMALIKNKGIDFTPADMADFWMSNIPILHTCTAERVAYRNFVMNIEPPQSAIYRNPYREWIGAQIRADFFGYVALGNPEFAAELAWRDASISHVKNGIYGEMWVAAMIAAAAVLSELEKIIEIGLSEIPENSRLTIGIRSVLKWYRSGVPYLDAVKRVHLAWDEDIPHHWCHTISNAQIVALGLLYGEGDFGKSICRAVHPCFDTDCNGATVGSIVGMVLGAQAIPKTWTAQMNDTVQTGVAGYHRVKISDLAKEMTEYYFMASGKKK